MDLQSNILPEIEVLDGLKQEALFLKQKYSHFTIDGNLVKEALVGGLEGEIGDEFKDQDQIKLLDIWTLSQDENLIKSILRQHFAKEANIETYKANNQASKLVAIASNIQLKTDMALADLVHIDELQQRIEAQEEKDISLNGENISLKSISKYYSQKILQEIVRSKRKERNKSEHEYEAEIDPELFELLRINPEATQQNHHQIQTLAWKYNFFHLVQKSVDKGYVFTKRELDLIQDVVKDLSEGKVVLFTGDTGSGKTELARFLCTNFLETDYVFVGSSREQEQSDFTIEKVVTSKSRINNDAQIIDGTTPDIENAEKVFGEIVSSTEFKDAVLAHAKANEKSESEISILKKELEDMEINKKSLVTEYHLMGIYKAANAGIPCIIDEVNLIRPEVFMALNDLLTKRPGNVVKYPNALGELTVKAGFCIILTGNDPEQNTKVKRYNQGRYLFDEAVYNRLRVYAKNYFHQLELTHTEYKGEEGVDEDIDAYLDENELYGVILMMMFRQESRLNTSGKYGFEVMKRNFEGGHLDKNEFFAEIKKFAHAIALIQKAFAGEVIQLGAEFASKSLKDMIRRKVFSMRNLIEVLSSYKGDTLPLDSHIYNEFIKHTSNEEEKYALFIVFKKYGFFGNLVTDNMEKTFKNIDIKIVDLNKTKTITLDDIEHRVIITKQDLYKEYFGTMFLSNEIFETAKADIEEIASTDKSANERENYDVEANEVSSEALLETLDVLYTYITTPMVYNQMEIILHITLSQLLEFVRRAIVDDTIDHNRYHELKKLLIQLANIFEEMKNPLSRQLRDEFNAELSRIILPFEDSL